ncbi:class I SAM-dependent methyltransferase [Paenibacillus sp. MBLB4367]|uniref:class I SAM-dependent methyltransferase n=1 Tax=Paenibacillus sp. MBLB4367 TaxID=3384767 RepID=UPI00390807E8
MALFGSERDSRIYEAIKAYNEQAILQPQLVIDEVIASLRQNNVAFTGERVVINDAVESQYRNVLEEHIARYALACRLIKGMQVLDAACGTGYGAKMMEAAGAAYITGVDISEESIAHARNDYGGDRISYLAGDVRSLPFAAASFDAVVSFETIEHIPDGSVWIREAARVLKPKGLFIVSTPNRGVTNAGLYYCEQPINRYHHFEYTVTEFSGELMKEFDLLELYGQTFVSDTLHAGVQFLRQIYHRNMQYMPKAMTAIAGHNLLPLGHIKNAQPAYVVAVCRKK